MDTDTYPIERYILTVSAETKNDFSLFAQECWKENILFREISITDELIPVRVITAHALIINYQRSPNSVMKFETSANLWELLKILKSMDNKVMYNSLKLYSIVKKMSEDDEDWKQPLTYTPPYENGDSVPT